MNQRDAQIVWEEGISRWLSLQYVPSESKYQCAIELETLAFY